MAENKDISQIAISSHASSVADSLLEKGYFKDKADVLTFAAGYMIRNHFNDFDPRYYYTSDSGSYNVAQGTFDPDGKWHTVLTALYETEKPYSYLRLLMDAGLLEIQKVMELNPGISISDLLE